MRNRFMVCLKKCRGEKGLHLGRPYVLRTLRRCGLRLGADIWWMSYLLIRDAVLLMTFALSWIFFAPNLVVNQALPLTGPLAALCLLLALAVKLSRRVDDDVTAYRIATAFLVLGATLYYGALVFAIEATSQGYLAGFGQIFTSSANPTTALIVMAGVVIVAGWLFVRALQSANRAMARSPPRVLKQPQNTLLSLHNGTTEKSALPLKTAHFFLWDVLRETRTDSLALRQPEPKDVY